MPRHRYQSPGNECHEAQEAHFYETRPSPPQPTYQPSSSMQQRQPYEFQAAEQVYRRYQDIFRVQERGSPRYHDDQQPCSSRHVLESQRTAGMEVDGQTVSSTLPSGLGGNRKPPPEPIVTNGIQKTGARLRRSPRNVDRSRPSYIDTPKAQKHRMVSPGSPVSTRSMSRSLEAKKLAEKTLRGMQIPESVQIAKAKKGKAILADKKAMMDKASMNRMAAAIDLFHDHPGAKPYFHNVWHEETNSRGQTERHAEKILFIGHLENKSVSAITSPDRRLFLLRQEEIDQKAHIAPISWAGFSYDERLRTNNPYGSINYNAAMQLMMKQGRLEDGARVTKHGQTLRLLERHDILDHLTPEEREKVFNFLRNDMLLTPATPTQEQKGHDGGSGFLFRSSKRSKKQKQLVEKWERGMLSNKEVMELQEKGILPQIQRSRQERRLQGPVSALYEHDWEAEWYGKPEVPKQGKKWYQR